MLVATAGQTTAYVLHAKKSLHATNNSNSSTTNNSCSSNNISNNSNNTTNSNIANNSLSLTHKTARHVLANCVAAAASSVISSKTLPIKLAAPTNYVGTTSSYNSSNSSNTNNHSNIAVIASTSSCIASSSNALMKTLSVRLNRGTEFLKETVQKAFTSKLPAQLSTVLNLYTVPPTATHRCPQQRLNVCSADSLQPEMCHFKPIRTAPTTPWKSSSKSRGGASLKMPQASHAKQPLKYCDDDDVVDDEDANAAAFNLEGFSQFRPKPSSTLLTTIITTPERPSAFVCLLAQMRSISSQQQKKSSHRPCGMELHRTKTTRACAKPKPSMHLLQPFNPPLQEILRKRRNPFVHVKNLNLPTELLNISRSRRSLRCQKSNIFLGNNNKKSATASVASASALRSKSRSRITVVKAKTKQDKGRGKNGAKTTMKKATMTTTTLAANIRTRKRKANEMMMTTAAAATAAMMTVDSVDDLSLRPTVRKSARLSKDCCPEVMKFAGTQKFVRLQRRQARAQSKRLAECFTPPLTRLRLRQMADRNVKLNAALEYQNRII